MKNKKNRLTFGLLILTVFLGVGFAVVSSVDLTISGTAGSKEHSLAVYFSNTSTDNTGCTGATVKAGLGEDVDNPVLATTKPGTASIEVTDLEKVGDYVTATYTITNDETDIDALVKVKTDGIVPDSSNGFFQVTTDIDPTDGTLVEAGSTNTVTVKVELIKVPIDENDSSTTVTVELEATPQQPQPEE